jgi:hypothetical protein
MSQMKPNTYLTPGFGRILAFGLGKFIETLPFVADNAGEFDGLL